MNAQEKASLDLEKAGDCGEFIKDWRGETSVRNIRVQLAFFHLQCSPDRLERNS
jgi:hypothetical protein